MSQSDHATDPESGAHCSRQTLGRSFLLFLLVFAAAIFWCSISLWDGVRLDISRFSSSASYRKDCEMGTSWSPYYHSCICTSTLPETCKSDMLNFRLILPDNKDYIVVGEPIEFHIQPLSIKGYPIVNSRQSLLMDLIVSVDHIDEFEHFVSQNVSYNPNGYYSHSFKVLTPGTFEVQIYRAGQKGWINLDGVIDPLNKEAPFTHTYQASSSEFAKIGAFLLTAHNPPNYPQGMSFKWLQDHMEALETCPGGQDLKEFNGRWVNSSLLPVKYSQDSLVEIQAGHNETFVGENCALQLYSQQEARKCLQGKSITILGDSTLQEFALELLSYIAVSTPPTVEYNVSKIAQQCAPRGFTSKTLEGPSLTFCWAGSPHPCQNAIGLLSWANATFRDRMEACASYPEQGLDASDNMMDPQIDRTLPPTVKPDFLLFNSGFHDIAGWSPSTEPQELIQHDRLEVAKSASFPITGQAEDYGTDLKTVFKFLKTIPAKRYIYMETLPRIANLNWWPPYINAIARRVANESHFDFLPRHESGLTRLSRDGSTRYGDTHHIATIGRTPLMFLHIQIFLNKVCK